MADHLLCFLLADGSLFTYMKKLYRRLTDKEAMHFFIQVLDAVHHLHNLGIIHKDLKGKISYQRCSIHYRIVIIVVVIIVIILPHEKFLQSDWLRAVVFQLNLKYLHVTITNFLQVVV